MIAAILGTANVPAYAVPMMVVQLFFALEIAVLDGIWPAYTEAAGRGDVGWIRIAHRRLTVALVASALVSRWPSSSSDDKSLTPGQDPPSPWTEHS